MRLPILAGKGWVGWLAEFRGKGTLSSPRAGTPGKAGRGTLDLASITSLIHNWLLFLLWLHPFILSGVISPLISSSIFGT